MLLDGMNHVAIITSDTERLHAFYRDIFDATVSADMTERVTTLLDEADEFCRSGQLLTLEAPPDVVIWRHWWRDQVVGQIRHGATPTPFPG